MNDKMSYSDLSKKMIFMFMLIIKFLRMLKKHNFYFNFEISIDKYTKYVIALIFIMFE
jgi:hypothetical protein